MKSIWRPGSNGHQSKAEEKHEAGKCEEFNVLQNFMTMITIIIMMGMMKKKTTCSQPISRKISTMSTVIKLPTAVVMRYNDWRTDFIVVGACE